MMGINTTSVFRLSRAAVGVMHEGSAIVNIASVFGLRGNPNSAAYAASKAAIVGLTRQMAAEHGPRGIRVNAVAPGLIVTDMTRERTQTSRRFRQLLVETTPFPRLGQPEDVAAAVTFLASDEAGFISGQVLAVDGGWLVANNRPTDDAGASGSTASSIVRGSSLGPGNRRRAAWKRARMFTPEQIAAEKAPVEEEVA